MAFAPNLVPHPVTHTSSRLLEFETLLGLLAGYAFSPLGQGRIAALRPSLDHAWIETQHQLTTEIREYRRVGGRFEFAGLPEVRKLIEKSRIAGSRPVKPLGATPTMVSGWLPLLTCLPTMARSEWNRFRQ